MHMRGIITSAHRGDCRRLTFFLLFIGLFSAPLFRFIPVIGPSSLAGPCAQLASNSLRSARNRPTPAMAPATKWSEVHKRLPLTPALAPESEPPYPSFTESATMGAVLYCSTLLCFKWSEAWALLRAQGPVSLLRFLAWADAAQHPALASFATTAATEDAEPSAGPWTVLLFGGGLALFGLLMGHDLPGRIGKAIALKGISSGSTRMFHFGVAIAVGPNGLPPYTALSEDPTYRMDRVGIFTPLCGREPSGKSTAELASAAFTLDALLRGCMAVRRAGAATAATDEIETFLEDRLVRVLVYGREHRIKHVVDLKVSSSDGVTAKHSTAPDDVPPADAVELNEDGTIRPAAVLVQLRQVAVRALSPAVYARIVTAGKIFPAVQAGNVNAVLRCTPAPISATVTDAIRAAVEADGRHFVAGGVQSGKGAPVQMLPMPVALSFVVGDRPEMLRAAVAAGADPFTQVSSGDYAYRDDVSTCAQGQPCSLMEAATVIDRLQKTPEGGKECTVLRDAINEGLALREVEKTS